ncbi:MAG: HlyD family secretion protein [Pirellulales bacterium]
MNALVATFVASTVLAVGQVPAEQESAPGTITVPRCLVTLLHEVEIPAEETGILTQLPVVLGQTVVKGDILALTDDKTALLQKAIAEHRLNKAVEQANNDVDFRYAVKAAEVAETEHKMYLATNAKEPGTHAKITIQKAKLAWERADLQREQAEMNQKIAGMAADESRAERDATELAFARCETNSPLDGIVVRMYKEEGEWVRPGEPLMRVIGMRHLKVEGSVPAYDYEPRELFHKSVTVEITLPNKKIKTLHGYINFVSPEIDAAGHYDISAKITNEKVDGFWKMLPGEVANMVIKNNDPTLSKEAIAKLSN